MSTTTATCDAAAAALQALVLAAIEKELTPSYPCQEPIMNALAVQAAVCGHDSFYPRFSNPRVLHDLCLTFGINLLVPTVQLIPTSAAAAASAVPVDPPTSAVVVESSVDPSPAAAADTEAPITTDSANPTSTSKPSVIIPSAKGASPSPSSTVSAAASAAIGSTSPPAGIPTAGIVGITFGVLILGLIAAIVYSRKKKRAVQNQELVFSSNRSTNTMELEARRGDVKKMAYAEKEDGVEGGAGRSVRYAPPVNAYSSHGKQ
ncbi:hypothetical protein BJ741DRAFT_667301 [Chytriomyces cf. hyalinus JEL632]|nr:hypothetical protein BJ741DRAFT_667301 [Chytriomyces cf. hyalinus JEL632]